MKSISKESQYYSPLLLPSKMVTMDDLVSPVSEKRNLLDEKLDGSAQLLDRGLPLVWGNFEMGLERWDDKYRHLKPWCWSYRKVDFFHWLFGKSRPLTFLSIADHGFLCGFWDFYMAAFGHIGTGEL